MNIEELKYPIGKYSPIKEPSSKQLVKWIQTLEDFPNKIKAICENLSDEEKNYCYRPDGWAIKQVVHHCADSHMNSFIRFKLALTENSPTIRPYFEERWADLHDSLSGNLTDSFNILKGVHSKWALLIKNLSQNQLLLEFVHPESGKSFCLAETVGLYAWHCDHHYQHVMNALAAKGKFN